MMDRRKFLTTGLAGAGILGAGATIGYIASRRPVTGQEGSASLDERFNYDVSAYAKIDPSLLLYEESTQFPIGPNKPHCLAVAGDTILVGGDKVLQTFDHTGKLLQSRELPGAPLAVTAGGLVAFKDRFAEVSYGERAHLTAIAASGDNVFVADAGNREVLRCDLAGKVLAQIKGFLVPSPYFDLHIGPDGLLWVVNPGKHRVEAYTLDGQYETGWGETAMSVEGFCGCCNPVHVARLPDGGFVTSEKGLNRIKIYTGTGKFFGVVAGVEQLGQAPNVAFDVACDSAGRVLVLDPVRRAVRVFVRKETA